MPPQLIFPFVFLLNLVHSCCDWPPQILFNLFSLIAKMMGGTRPIAKTPILYRLWCIARSPVIKEWSRSTCPEWEHAAEGKNAFGSAAIHQWANELAIVTGLDAGALLWDIHNFFDSINYEDVQRAASSLNYPSSDLKLALHLHRSPRLLSVGGATSCALIPNRGILQGCMHSMYLARSVTYHPVRRVGREQRAEAFVSPTTTSTYVDDVVQWAIGKTRNIYINRCCMLVLVLLVLLGF